MNKKIVTPIIVLLILIGISGVLILNNERMKTFVYANQTTTAEIEDTTKESENHDPGLINNDDESEELTEPSTEATTEGTTEESTEEDTEEDTEEPTVPATTSEEHTEPKTTEKPSESSQAGGNNSGESLHISLEELKAIIGSPMYNYKGDAVEITGEINQYTLINKKNALTKDYIPPNLREVQVTFSFSGWDEKRQMEDNAATALESLFAGSKADGNDLRAVSGYRSYSRQNTLFQNYSNSYGVEEANKFSARPGQSEHQSGLAMDVSCAAVGYDLDQSFEDTKEGKWLKDHAAEYGFIIRYPKDKTDITGYMYEPWHLRYVGVPLATYLVQENLTLDEFYATME